MMSVTKEVLTPCAALFDMMKRYGGISYKDLASLILSGKPLSDGVSPVSRINDRAWLSRFVVHAPVGSVQEQYFADFPSASLRVVARLKANKRKSLLSRETLDLVTGEKGQEMIDALVACHQDISLYRNVLLRLLRESGFTENERAEMAMVVLVTAGCTASVRKAAEQVMSFSRSVHGAGMATPLVTPESIVVHSAVTDPVDPKPVTLVLFRVVDGYIAGAPYYLNAGPEGTEIGSLTLSEGAITDVGPDVSGKHLLLTCEGGQWYAQGLGSKFGTVLINGADHEEVVVELPQSERSDGEAIEAVPVNPGDELLLGASTRFMIIEGIDPTAG